MDSVGFSVSFILLFCQWIAVPATETSWSYTGEVGQSSWPDHFPNCGGSSQSPVDVVTRQTTYNPALTPVTPLGYSQYSNEPFTLYNNGHTAVVNLPPWMGLGGLPWLYSAVQLHFHWGNGAPGRGGSEHTINGQSAAAEVHVVHYNAELYINMSIAMNQRDGLAVLAILIEAGDETNEGYGNILNHLGRIKHAGQKVAIPAFDITSLLPKDLGRYYRYNGSLTTPPCYQSVLWTLLHQTVKISHVQLLKLEALLYASEAQEEDRVLLQDNYRSTQPLNNRTVFSSFPAESGKVYTAGEITAVVMGSLCGCVGLAVIIRFIVKTIRFFKHLRNETVAVNSSTSSWDVLPSIRPAPMPRVEPEKETKQDMALNSTSAPGRKEQPVPTPSTEP